MWTNFSKEFPVKLISSDETFKSMLFPLRVANFAERKKKNVLKNEKES